MRIRNTVLFLLLGMGALTIFAVAQAERVPTYAGSVLVDSSTIGFRSPAFADAWLNALARHTGKTEAQLRRVPAAMPPDLAKAIERYHFESIPPAYWPDGKPTYWLHIFASKKWLDSIVDQAGLPSWPTERPAVLAWLLDDTGAVAQLAVNTSDLASAYWLQKRLEQAGLPMRLAGASTQDQQAVSPESIRQKPSEVIAYSRETRGESPVLLLVVSSADQSTTGPLRWQMTYALPGEPPEHDNGMAASVDAVARQVASRLRQWHASRERIYPEERQVHEVPVKLTGLVDYADVQAATDWLNRLSVVDGYRIRQSRPGQLDLLLHLGVTTEAFLRYATRDGRFQIIQHEPLILEKR